MQKQKPKKPLTLQQKQQMKKPFTPRKCPMNIKLVPGKQYLYCTCGLSNDQPFCDGSHQGSKFKPISFIAKYQSVSCICGCKRNDPSAGPYCDGSHNDVDW